MSPLSNWWDYYHRRKEHFGNDQTHHKAHCCACVRVETRKIVNDEIEAAYARGDPAAEARPESVIMEEGKL